MLVVRVAADVVEPVPSWHNAAATADSVVNTCISILVDHVAAQSMPHLQ